MLPVATDDPVAWCLRQPICLPRAAVLCKNGLETDQGTIRGGDSWRTNVCTLYLMDGTILQWRGRGGEGKVCP